MPEIKNAAYFGTNGTITVDGDQHFGVTSCALVPTTQKSQVEDISGDVQSFVGTPMWRLQITAHQDHKTAGALVRESIAWHGQEKPITYVPDDGGDSIAIDVVWEAAQIGGGTGLRSFTLDLGCIGQPVITPAA